MERNTIVVADALEWCRLLDAGSIDVFWSSPPYNLRDPLRNGSRRGIEQDYASQTKHRYAAGTGEGDGSLLPEWEYQEQQCDVLRSWYEALHPDGIAFYNHKVRIKDGEAISPLRWISRTPFVVLQEVVWDRGSTQNVDTIRFLPVSERIYVLTKRPGIRLDNPRRLQDVLRIPPNLPGVRAKSGHPCPTHPAVVWACLSVVPRLAGRRLLVADCYVGSGTTAHVARQLGMDYIGCDRSAAYVTLAQARLATPLTPMLELSA